MNVIHSNDSYTFLVVSTLLNALIMGRFGKKGQRNKCKVKNVMNRQGCAKIAGLSISLYCPNM